MSTITLNDVVLDLVQILEEAGDSGRLVGSETTTIEDVKTDGYIDREVDTIVVTLSNGEKFDLVVEVGR
jgi:hypothetical protein